MKKQKQKSKGKRASFLLGLSFTLLMVVLGLNLVVSGIDSLTYSSINTHDEAIAMIVGGACVVILGVLHFRSGVFMTICGAVSSIGMVAALVAFLSDYIPNGKFIADGKPNGEAIAILGLLTACLVIGILELIGGIIAIRNVKRMKKTSPWIRKHKKPVDFLKCGLATSETIIEGDYSKAFYDKGNLNVFKVVFPDATVLYRQQAVLRIANRLFVAGNDLSGNADGELTFFFEVIKEKDGEKLNPVFGGTEEHSLLTKKYYKLTGYVEPKTAKNGLSAANNGESKTNAAGANAHIPTQDRIPQNAKKVIMIIIFALYAVTLVLGVLTATTGMLDGALSSTVKDATKEVGRAYGIIMGLVWVTALPSVGYYIAFVSPLKINKRGKFFIAAGSVVLSIILDIVFFAVTKNYRPLLDSNDKWFVPFTVIAGSVCSFVCYLLTILRTDALALKEIGGKSLKESNGLFEVIRVTVVGIFNFLLKVAALILRFKDAFTTVYALIAALLFTLLLPFTTFIVSFIIIALVLCTLVLLFSGFLHFAYENPSVGYDETGKQMYSVYENGSERILTYNSYDTFHSRDVYIDDIGNYWHTNDNGETFYKD
ncbi:MAG: hypothetical protein KH405_03050 [Firmicutes bacterium]|nr:hypothetical protein [Bacillota bacterium]